ncbi:MAG: hypothetical protein ACSHYB_07035 [Roseibacillus sp.]
MKLSDDITSARLLKVKGLLFAALGLVASTLLLITSPTLSTAILLAIAIWAFCRFYYFPFYVLENYAGQKRPYSGLWDALREAVKMKESTHKEDSQ